MTEKENTDTKLAMPSNEKPYNDNGNLNPFSSNLLVSAIVPSMWDI